MSVQPQELRIGNWINFVSVPVKMSAINWEEWGELRPYFEYDCYPYYTSTFDNIHPIPLTPSILQNNGFHWDMITHSKGEIWYCLQSTLRPPTPKPILRLNSNRT